MAIAASVKTKLFPEIEGKRIGKVVPFGRQLTYQYRITFQWRKRYNQ